MDINPRVAKQYSFRLCVTHGRPNAPIIVDCCLLHNTLLDVNRLHINLCKQNLPKLANDSAR